MAVSTIKNRVLDIAHGGTGATTAAGARSAISAPLLLADIGDKTSYSLTLPLVNNKFRHGFLSFKTTIDNDAYAAVYMVAVRTDEVYLTPIYKGASSRTITASLSGTTLTITANMTVYGGIRLLWLG